MEQLEQDRRSMFGSQRRRPSFDRSQPDTRPSTAQSEVSESRSSSTTELPAVETRMAKRTVGVAAIPISTLIRQQKEMHQSVTMWAPTFDSPSSQAEGWDDHTSP